MMRHHFQSQFFWKYHLAQNDSSDCKDFDEDKVKNGGEKKKIANLTLVTHRKVDCAFIFLAIFIVTGFTLTISSFGAQKTSLVDIFGFYDESFDDEVAKVNLTKIFSDMVPLSYILYVYPKISQKKFSSVVKIEFECKQKLSEIAFHSSKLNVYSIALTTEKDGSIPFSHTHKGSKDATIIFLDNPLQPGVKYQLLITSSGVLTYDRSQSLYLVEAQNKYQSQRYVKS